LLQLLRPACTCNLQRTHPDGRRTDRHRDGYRPYDGRHHGTEQTAGRPNLCRPPARLRFALRPEAESTRFDKIPLDVIAPIPAYLGAYCMRGRCETDRAGYSKRDLDHYHHSHYDTERCHRCPLVDGNTHRPINSPKKVRGAVPSSPQRTPGHIFLRLKDDYLGLPPAADFVGVLSPVTLSSHAEIAS
jgi:hypothetical protein